MRCLGGSNTLNDPKAYEYKKYIYIYEKKGNFIEIWTRTFKMEWFLRDPSFNVAESNEIFQASSEHTPFSLPFPFKHGTKLFERKIKKK